MESWLYCSNVLLLVLGAAYSAFGTSNFSEPVMIATEMLLASSLFGGLIAAAAFFVRDWYTHKHALREVRFLSRSASKSPPRALLESLEPSQSPP